MTTLIGLASLALLLAAPVALATAAGFFGVSLALGHRAGLARHHRPAAPPRPRPRRDRPMPAHAGPRPEPAPRQEATTMTLGEKIAATIEARSDHVLAVMANHYSSGVSDGLREAARIARDMLDRAARGEICEHGVEDGDWCPDCNREYKEAATDNDEGSQP